MQEFKNVPITIKAQSEENAKKKLVVIKNMLENISDSAFCETLYQKIQKDPQFFKKIANSPLLKMF